jgi:hypothetical protein
MMDEDGELIKNWVHNGLSDEMPFGQMMNKVAYKYLYRNYYKIEGNLLNISNNDYILSHLDNIILDPIDTKIFLIGTIAVDIREEQAEITLVELLDEATTDDFDAAATTERTQYVSDVGGTLTKGYLEKKERSPADYQLGYLGYIFAQLQDNRRRGG